MGLGGPPTSFLSPESALLAFGASHTPMDALERQPRLEHRARGGGGVPWQPEGRRFVHSSAGTGTAEGTTAESTGNYGEHLSTRSKLPPKRETTAPFRLTALG